jgi:hypothetical protein
MECANLLHSRVATAASFDGSKPFSINSVDRAAANVSSRAHSLRTASSRVIRGTGAARRDSAPPRVSGVLGLAVHIRPSLVPQRRGNHQWMRSGGVGHSPTELSDSRLYRFGRGAHRVGGARRVRAAKKTKVVDDHPPLRSAPCFPSGANPG